MKNRVIQRIKQGVALCLLGGLLGAARPAAAQQAGCWLAISSPNDTASVVIAVPWALTLDFAAADNPAYFSNYIAADTAGLPTGSYRGWCIDVPDNIDLGPQLYNTQLFSSCDTNIETDIPMGYPASVYVNNTAWHEINYLLNHKNGAYFWDVQLAIWSLIGGPVDPSNLAPPYPANHPTVVSNLLYNATNFASSWQASCGGVIAVVVAIQANPHDQLTIIEMPYPCVPSVSITKQVACLQPLNDCGPFGKIASGYAGVTEPGFCYSVTVSNSGTMTLSNIVVLDTLLGDVTTNFFPNPASTLAPGAAITAMYKKQLGVNTTNTAAVVATALNSDSSPGPQVSAVDYAIALVDTASLTANLAVTSPCDMDGNPADNNVLMPGCGTPCAVTFTLQVSNSSTAYLTGITINAPALAALPCGLPAPFDLAPGVSTNIICTTTMTCPIQPLTVTAIATGSVAPDLTHCAYDITSTNVVSVSSALVSGTVECGPEPASITGVALLHCSMTDATTNGDMAMPNLTVTLTDVNSNILASTFTGTNGVFSFPNLPTGSYIVMVTAPANYSESLPQGVTDNQIAVTMAACQTTNLVFGYQDQTPVVITSLPTGGELGCNPANIPTVASITAQVIANDDFGSALVNVIATPGGSTCAPSLTFSITATGTCGTATNTSVVYTWKSDTTPPVITGAPTGGALGCNPATMPTDANVTALVTATDNCSTATITVTHLDSGTACAMTRTFTITAKDACGNVSLPKTATYTWSIDTTAPVITGAPTSGALGCNPATMPTDASVTALVTATDNCSTATITVSHLDSGTSCAMTRTFAITAQDACGNVSLPTAVTYTWTADTNAPVITCPPNVTIATNPAPKFYCTFTQGDWCGTSGGTQFGNNWWNCWSSSGFSQNNNWWTAWNNNNNNNWWGSSSGNCFATNWLAGCTGNNSYSILTNCFSSVYTNTCLQIGYTNQGNNCVKFTNPYSVSSCLKNQGNAGTLTYSGTNLTSCGGGIFCAQVLALQLNVNYGDCGADQGLFGRCGDLILNDPTSPCNGQSVRQILSKANCVLGGGSVQGCPASYLSGLVDNINHCYENCQPSSWCTNHLVTPTNSVPPPSQTGFAMAVDNCDPNPVITYSDSTTIGSCPGSLMVTRTWKATDHCGNVSSCVQTITVSTCSTLKLACPGGNGQVGVPFSAYLTPSGGTAPYQFTIVAGSLPGGLQLNPATGQIYGTPTSAGSFTFTAMVTDLSGNTAISTCSGGCAPSSVTWSFATPTGNVGTTQPYTVNGLTIMAYGFQNNGQPATLYGKNGGGDQNGLGIYGTANNEISTANFVQLDLQPLVAVGASGATISIDSVLPGQGYNVYGSQTLGSIGTLLISGNSDAAAFTIPSYPTYRYISVRASSGNVLLGAVGASVPSGCAITIAAAPCFGSIAGEVFNDCNGNGSVTGDSGMPNVTVTLKSGTKVVATTTTGSNGTYTFNNVTNGTYTIAITQPASCTLTYPAGCNNQQTVTVSNCKNVTGVNFAYTGQYACVKVTVSAPSSCSYGQNVTFTCTVTNAGTVCFTGGQVCAGNCGGWKVSCPSLSPGQSCTVTGSYCVSYWDSNPLTCNVTATAHCAPTPGYSGSDVSCQSQCTTHPGW